MFSQFFIHRPIFASVLSIIITLAGGIAVWLLPIAQYPEITPPTVEVSAIYPGADAQVVANTVAAPIEQQVNGVEGMLYMSSQCTNDGTYTLTVTFKLGVDLNIAQVLVQNRVAIAQPLLPDLVTRKGVTVKKKSPSVLMIVNLFSPEPEAGKAGEQPHSIARDDLYLSNLATISIRDELSRLPGVGDITYLGQRDYSMRLWLDPDKMRRVGLSAGDVVAAIQAQNIQVAAGQIGQPPVPDGQVFQYTMTTLGRLSTPEQFEQMMLKNDAAGRAVRMKDIARIELGAQGYDQSCTLNGRPSVALSVYQLPGTNALHTAKLIRDKMEELKRAFPEGVDYKIVYDTTPFITESIHEVFITLIDAVLLVAFVVLLFLQNWRSAIIPLVAVPVAVIGTFAVMAGIGFSLNNLTLFGLVLAIGIVVDDAIVVVEAVEHHIEQGLAPREAAIQAMNMVSGPVIAVGLVLSAVFIPCAFISGITGQFFRQFALTIAVSTVISAFNSLTLSPALAAILLRPRDAHHGRGRVIPTFAYPILGAGLAWRFLATPVMDWLEDHAVQGWNPQSPGFTWKVSLAVALAGAIAALVLAWPLDRVMAYLFRKFNVAFNWSTEVYARAVSRILRVSAIVLAVYGGLLILTRVSFDNAPAGFIPMQDKGYLLVNVQLPDAASVQRTSNVMSKIDKIARQTPGVKNTVAVAGDSILLGANSPNFGALYIMLDDFRKRTPYGRTSEKIAHQLEERFRNEIDDAVVGVYGAPPVDGLGTAGGFKIVIEDRTSNGLKTLQDATEQVVDAGREKPSELRGMFSSFRADTPWLFLDINREQAKILGLSVNDVFTSLQVFLGSLYVNDLNWSGRTWQVNVQSDSRFRRQINDVKQLSIRNSNGQMVPLSTIAKVKSVNGPVMIYRYNMYSAAPVNGGPAAGVSSGEAIGIMEGMTRQVTNNVQGLYPEWTELAKLQLETGNTAMYVFVLAVVLVFLVLAAQYESWSLPLAVILVVPMCLLCSIVGVIVAKLDVNIFTQIGFVVLVGLACKNAILIVEYARRQTEQGKPRHEATIATCKLRLRPIMMTSLAFILGVVPLVISTGAGAEMRRTLGTAVFAGMLGVTLFGIFLTPVFYSVIQWSSDWYEARRAAAEKASMDEVPAKGEWAH
jgi:multidrug efflux pump subunit AcrB